MSRDEILNLVCFESEEPKIVLCFYIADRDTYTEVSFSTEMGTVYNKLSHQELDALIEVA